MDERETTSNGAAATAEAARCQRDLYLLWRAVETAGALPLTTRGYVTRPALRRIRARLAAVDGLAAPTDDCTEAEEPRLLFLRRLLERLGLLIRTPDAPRLVTAERETLARYLEHPLAERVRICARLWVAGGWWPERLEPRSEPPRLLAPAPPRVALGRRRLLLALASAEPGSLWPIPVAAGRPAKAARAQAAPEGERETVRAALLGPLAWLGIVGADGPSGEQRAAEPAQVRVLPVAAALRPDAPAPSAASVEPQGRVAVLPTLAIIAYPPLTAPTLALLDSCAEEVRLERTAQYRLDRAACARVQRSGVTAEELCRRLEALSGQPLPDTVRVALEDWQRQGERLRLTADARVLTVSEAALLDALLADRAASGWVERRLTPLAALLTAEGVHPVRAWLLRRGQLPATQHYTAEDTAAGTLPAQSR